MIDDPFEVLAHIDKLLDCEDECKGCESTDVCMDDMKTAIKELRDTVQYLWRAVVNIFTDVKIMKGENLIEVDSSIPEAKLETPTGIYS